MVNEMANVGNQVLGGMSYVRLTIIHDIIAKCCSLLFVYSSVLYNDECWDAQLFFLSISTNPVYHLLMSYQYTHTTYQYTCSYIFLFSEIRGSAHVGDNFGLTGPVVGQSLFHVQSPFHSPVGPGTNPFMG